MKICSEVQPDIKHIKDLLCLNFDNVKNMLKLQE